MTNLFSFIGMFLVVGVSSFALFLLTTAPFYWLSIAFMIYCRPRSVIPRAAGLFVAIWLAATLVLPLGEGGIIGFYLALFFTPWPAKHWASTAAFRADSASTRAAAAEIHNLKLEREGTARRVSPDKHWRDYIMDSERARLASIYQLPAMFPV